MAIVLKRRREEVVLTTTPEMGDLVFSRTAINYIALRKLPKRAKSNY